MHFLLLACLLEASLLLLALPRTSSSSSIEFKPPQIQLSNLDFSCLLDNEGCTIPSPIILSKKVWYYNILFDAFINEIFFFTVIGDICANIPHAHLCRQECRQINKQWSKCLATHTPYLLKAAPLKIVRLKAELARVAENQANEGQINAQKLFASLVEGKITLKLYR